MLVAVSQKFLRKLLWNNAQADKLCKNVSDIKFSKAYSRRIKQ